jgi:hypothetical protein
MGWRIAIAVLVLTVACCWASVAGDQCDAAGGHLVRYQGCVLP